MYPFNENIMFLRLPKKEKLFTINYSWVNLRNITWGFQQVNIALFVRAVLRLICAVGMFPFKKTSFFVYVFFVFIFLSVKMVWCHQYFVVTNAPSYDSMRKSRSNHCADVSIKSKLNKKVNKLISVYNFYIFPFSI